MASLGNSLRPCIKIIKKEKKNKCKLELRWSSVAEYFSSMGETLGLIPSTRNKKQTERGWFSNPKMHHSFLMVPSYHPSTVIKRKRR